MAFNALVEMYIIIMPCSLMFYRAYCIRIFDLYDTK